MIDKKNESELETTQIIDTALAKIHRVNDFVLNRVTYHLEKNELKPKDPDDFTLLLNKHKIEYFTKYAREKQVILNVQYFLVNKNLAFDPYLFRLLELRIFFSNQFYSRYAGKMSSDGDMRINIDDDKVSFTKEYDYVAEITAHELGHAWNFQLANLIKISSDEMCLLAGQYFLEQLNLIEPFLPPLDWSTQKEYFVNIFSYGSKNLLEMFAEMFSISCVGTQNSRAIKFDCQIPNELIDSASKNTINFINNFVKARLFELYSDLPSFINFWKQSFVI